MTTMFKYQMKLIYTIGALLVLYLPHLESEEPKIGDVIYVTKQFSITTDSGIHGVRIGKKVILIRDDLSHYVIKDGDIEGKAPKDSFTTDADLAQELSAQQQQRASAAYNSYIEIQKNALATASKARLQSVFKGNPDGIREMEHLGAKRVQIVVKRVENDQVLGDEMTSASAGGSSRSIGLGGGGFSFKVESGRIYHYQGVIEAAEGDSLDVIVIENGTYKAKDIYDGERTIKSFKVLAIQPFSQ